VYHHVGYSAGSLPEEKSTHCISAEEQEGWQIPKLYGYDNLITLVTGTSHLVNQA